MCVIFYLGWQLDEDVFKDLAGALRNNFEPQDQTIFTCQHLIERLEIFYEHNVRFYYSIKLLVATHFGRVIAHTFKRVILILNNSFDLTNLFIKPLNKVLRVTFD
jgi:hypothetical protein